jgi:hypothetical protein
LFAPCCWVSLQACKALRSASQHGIQVLAQQVLHKLQQKMQPDNFTSRPMLWRLPHTNAAAAAAVARIEASMAAAIAAAAALDGPHLLAAAVEAAERADAEDLRHIPGTLDAFAAAWLLRNSQLANPRMSWSYWDDLQAAIAAGTHSEASLCEDAAFLGVANSIASTGGKDSVAAAVLGAFGLSVSSSSSSSSSSSRRVVPTVLLVACKREQCGTQIVADGPDNCVELHFALKRLSELAREVWLPLGLQAQRWGYGEHLCHQRCYLHGIAINCAVHDVLSPWELRVLSTTSHCDNMHLWSMDACCTETAG